MTLKLNESRKTLNLCQKHCHNVLESGGNSQPRKLVLIFDKAFYRYSDATKYTDIFPKANVGGLRVEKNSELRCVTLKCAQRNFIPDFLLTLNFDFNG